MSRAMWSGAISFGMVTIPVKLYTATESHNIAFHLLHEKCDTRIKEQRYCPHCEEQVDWSDIVKGYEYSKGKYIELTSDDFEKLPLPSKHTIDLSSFVPEGDIDPVYFDSTYYIEIDEKAAQKPYKLLMDAMDEKGVIGVATVTFRTKERLCALRAVDGRLVLQTLLYQDEIKKNDTEKPSSIKVSPQERKMAESLIDALQSDFNPEQFKDKYQAALKKLIDAKLKGKEPAEVETQPSAGVTDLMEALRASVERAKSASPGHTRASGESATRKTHHQSTNKHTTDKPAKKAVAKRATAKETASQRSKAPAKRRGGKRSRAA